VARTRLLAIGLTAVLAMAACTSAKKTPSDGVPTLDQAKVTAEVQAEADKIATQVGQPLQNKKIAAQPCVYKKKENDGSVVVIQATYSIALPEADHVAAVARVREAWKAAGWTIGTDTTEGKTAELTGTSPAKFSARVGSMDPPKALVVVAQSGCFHTQTKA
jgi:hypothetical protein